MNICADVDAVSEYENQWDIHVDVPWRASGIFEIDMNARKQDF